VRSKLKISIFRINKITQAKYKVPFFYTGWKSMNVSCDASSRMHFEETNEGLNIRENTICHIRGIDSRISNERAEK
jgi:hypothetical protein